MALKGSCKLGHTLPEAVHKLAAERAKYKPDPVSGGFGQVPNILTYLFIWSLLDFLS